eukprot:304010_1
MNPRSVPPHSHHIAQYYSPNHHQPHPQYRQTYQVYQPQPARQPQQHHHRIHTRPQPQQQQQVRRPMAIPHFNLSQLPQIPVVIPPTATVNAVNAIIPQQLQVVSTHRPILTQSTTNNAFTHNELQLHSMPSNMNHINNLNIAQTLPNITYREPQSRTAPPKPPSPVKQASQLMIHSPVKPPTQSPMKAMVQHASPSKSSTHSHHSHVTNVSTKSRKRSISEIKDDDPNMESLEGASKRRKLNTERKIARSTATNRVWRQTRQNAKFRMAIELLDGFRADHGGKLPSLRAIMKMLKVGFPKAHEILGEYAKHVGCSKDKLV